MCESYDYLRETLCELDLMRTRILFNVGVQGVFFRATTEKVSRQFSVTGRVKNIPDGRVWLYAEGSETEVHAFLSQVCETKKDNITSVETETQRGSRKYTEFAVSY